MKAGGLWQFSVKNDFCWRQQAEILKAKDFQEKTIKGRECGHNCECEATRGRGSDDLW